MIHLFKNNRLSIKFTLILLINCNLLNAQNLTWKQPIHAGYDCFAVDIDSNNYIYSLCETWSHYPGSGFFDTTPIPRTIFNDNNRNIFLVKSDTNNSVQWINVIESPFGFIHPKFNISPSENIIIAGNVAGRIKCDTIDISFTGMQLPFFILQLDHTGKLNWINIIQQEYYSVEIQKIVFDSENNICLVGNVSDTVTFGDFDSLGQWTPNVSYLNPGGPSSFIAKYTQDGKFLSAKLIPIVNSQGGAYLYLKSMIIDNDDNVYVTGWFEGTIQYGSSTINSDGIEVIIIKFNKDMEVVWSKHFGPGDQTMMQQGNSLAFDKSKKNFYVTGNFIGSKDFGNGLVQSNDKNIFLAKYSLDGKLKWVKTSGCSSGAASYTEEGQMVYVNKDDFVYLGGNFYRTLYIGDTSINVYIDPNTSNDFSDFFIAKYYANGDFSWATNAGSEYSDELKSLVKDNYNHVFIGGMTYQESHFGEYTIVIPPDNLGSRGFLACFNDKPETNKYETSFGIEELKNVSDNIKIFPNPFIKNFEVNIQNKERSDISIQLIDLNGKTIFSNFEKSGNIIQNFSYQLNAEPSGTYCFKITVGNNIYTYKIVKL